MTLVDTNVLLDIYKADPVWMPWSVKQLRSAKQRQLTINMVVYAELAGHPAIPQRIDKSLDTLGIEGTRSESSRSRIGGFGFSPIPTKTSSSRQRLAFRNHKIFAQRQQFCE